MCKTGTPIRLCPVNSVSDRSENVFNSGIRLLMLMHSPDRRAGMSPIPPNRLTAADAKTNWLPRTPTVRAISSNEGPD